MILWTHQWFWLLATREDLHRVWGRFDNQRPSASLTPILTAVALILLTVAAAVVWQLAARRSSREFSSNSPRRLFRELCAAHGLNLSSRRLLKRLAAARGLANPAILFVEPQHFDAKNLPDSLKFSTNELRTLRDRLFHGP